jgi:hypothetical protein
VFSVRSVPRYEQDSFSLFIRNNPILSSERMLLKDYDRKGSAAKIISGREPKRLELIGRKLPIRK